jgi:hypothetical protein
MWIYKKKRGMIVALRRATKEEEFLSDLARFLAEHYQENVKLKVGKMVHEVELE